MASAPPDGVKDAYVGGSAPLLGGTLAAALLQSPQTIERLKHSQGSYYQDLFAAIDKADWARVQALFEQKADGPLHQVARAEYFLAPTSPRIEAGPLSDWLARGTDLPQATRTAAR